MVVLVGDEESHSNTAAAWLPFGRTELMREKVNLSLLSDQPPNTLHPKDIISTAVG